MTGFISWYNRVVAAIREHISRGNSRRKQPIRIQKPSRLRIIIPALEVIEPCLGIVVIAAIADWVNVCHGTGCRKHLSPSVIGVACDYASAGIYDLVYVALNVLDVIVRRSVIGETQDLAVGIVDVPKDVGAGLFRKDSAAAGKVFCESNSQRANSPPTVSSLVENLVTVKLKLH